MGEGRLGQVVRAVAGRGQHFRLRPREIYACRYPAQDRAVPDHLPVRAAHDLPLPDPRRPFEIRPFVARVLYDRGRGAQRSRLRHIQAPDRRPPDGGFRADRNDADPRHLSVDGAQARQYGRAQPPVRYRPADARRPFGRGRRTGADRDPYRPGEAAGAFQGVLPERRDDARGLARRRVLYGRRGMARRGRIFLVCGACRRRNQEFGLPDRPLRGGERPDDPSGRRRMCHHWGSRRDPGAGGQGDDHSGGEIQAAGRGGVDPGTAGSCEADHCALQVPAHHRIRGRTSEDHQR